MSKDLDKMVAESTEFIKKGEYLENLLDDLLNHDDLLDEL